MVRIFLVDDSAFVRRALSRVLQAHPEYRVVGEAANGVEALERIPRLDPDVVTLDLAMPGMDGLQVLRALLRWNPRLKVLMLSAHTREGAGATVEALSAGAVDFIDKASYNVMDLETLRREVLQKLEACVTRPVAVPAGKTASGPRPALDPAAAANCELCVIGASTGGPVAIQRIVERLPTGFPMPMLVVQHMPVGFTKPFAERLNALSKLQVEEATEGERLVPGQVRIAPAGLHLRITSNLAVVLGTDPADAKHVPSIDHTMKSAARARPGRVLGILLTGMGDDGAEGMAAIRAGGGLTLGENEASCVVYGMPRAAQARGGVSCMLSLPEIAGYLQRLTGGFPSASEARR
jgi:two-component system, chemotaxis family, protein-glutamate methylesterase/glutaminase